MRPDMAGLSAAGFRMANTGSSSRTAIWPPPNPVTRADCGSDRNENTFFPPIACAEIVEFGNRSRKRAAPERLIFCSKVCMVMCFMVGCFPKEGASRLVKCATGHLLWTLFYLRRFYFFHFVRHLPWIQSAIRISCPDSSYSLSSPSSSPSPSSFGR